MIAKNGGVMYQIQTEGALVATMMLIQQMTLGTELQDHCHRQIKRKEMGRSTTNREKVTYYGLSKKTTFCTIFRRQGHEGTMCPDCGDVPKQARRRARCKNCGVKVHCRNNCNNAAELRLKVS